MTEPSGALAYLLDTLPALLPRPAIGEPRIRLGSDVMAFGPAEPLLGPDAVAVGLDRTELDDTAPLQLGRVEGSQSAWFWLAGAPNRQSDPGSWRVTGLLTTTDDAHWAIDHLHLSHPLPNARIADYALACHTLPAVGASVAPGAAELVGLMQNNFGSGKLALLADRDDVVVIGTDPDEFWQGHDAFVEAISPNLDEIRALEPISRFDFPGGVRARLTADGTFGYVATNVVATFGEASLPPFRCSWTFARIAGTFRLVSDHHSARLT